MSARKKNQLADFEDKRVVKSTIAITNAGDGLSESMKVEPKEFHQGEKRYVVLECEVTKVAFAPSDREDPGGDQIRVHYFKAGTATIVDATLVADLIRDQEEKNLRAQEEAAGIERLPLEEGDAVKIRLRTWLTSVPKSQLQGLCDEHEIAYTTKTTGLGLIDLLADNAAAIKTIAQLAREADDDA